MYKDLNLIPAILGIWKAGGVYLPLDPNYPSYRTSIMVNDAQPKLLLSTKEILKDFSFYKGPVCLVDEVKKNPDRQRLNLPKPNDLAYFIYTSGSTGKPKGIQFDHRALAHAAKAYYDFHPERHTTLFFGSISFDPSLLILIYSVFGSSTICLSNQSGIGIENPDDICEDVIKNSVSFMLCCPGMYSKLLDEEKELSSLKVVDLCGEDLSDKIIQNHIQFAPNSFLYNAYGPSEYAIGVSAAKIFDPVTQIQSKVTIGKPFSNNAMYVLNQDFKQAKTGEKGEIFVGGPGLAKGYVNLGDLTQEKFISVKDLEKTPIDLYRTGDFGYSLTDESIVFLGRKDSQVRVKGSTVELGEVEDAMSKYLPVERAAVVVIPNSRKENVLIGFYSASEEIREESFISFLEDRLLPHMIPSRLTQVKEWPLTNNGKTDQRALVNSLTSQPLLI